MEYPNFKNMRLKKDVLMSGWVVDDVYLMGCAFGEKA